jgi:hypothetical protein
MSLFSTKILFSSVPFSDLNMSNAVVLLGGVLKGIKVEIDQCRMLLEKLKDERESNGTFIRLGITFLIINQKF